MTTANEVMEPCSDRNCILLDLTKPRGGMHTNGGCEHLGNGRPGTLALLRAMGAEIVRLRALPVISTCGDCAHLDCGMGGAYCTRLPPGERRDVPQNPVPGPVGYGTPPPEWCPLRGAP